MSIRVLVPVANGTEDVESVTIIDLLRRAGINVTVAGLERPVTFARGLKVIPDVLIEDISEEEAFDAIVLPGGMPGVTHLQENATLENLLKTQNKSNKLIGAICAAPLILDAHNILPENARITSFPSMKEDFSAYDYSEESVVVWNNIITSRGVGTAIDFSLKIIELLLDKSIADKISKDIVYKI